MLFGLKRSAWFFRPRNSHRQGRKKTRSSVRLALETLEDRLAPAGTGTVHFAVIGDYGSAGPNEAAVANLVKSWNPDFIMTVGDNNYEFGGADTIDQNVGQYYSSYISPYKGTYGTGAATNMFWPVLGNHDWEPPGAAPYLNYFTLPGNGRYYRLSEGPIDFFMLDSHSEEPDGYDASSVQAAWLQAQLAQSTAPWKIVDIAQAPYSTADVGSSTTSQWPFQQWGATAVLSGHAHAYEHFDVNGIPYFVDGTGGAALDTFVSPPLANEVVRDSGAFGAMLIDASASQITYQYITTAGTVLDTLIVNYPLPAAPSNLKAAQVSGSQVNLTWTDNANNESGYRVERSTGQGGNFSVVATLGIQANQYLDSAVSPGASYSYRVSAFNAGGSSAYSNTAGVSVPKPLMSNPMTPSKLATRAASASQINLTWTDNSLGLDRFSVERSIDGSNYPQIATVAAGTTSYADDGLASGNYFYRIRGVDLLGNYTDYTAVVMGVLAPIAPSGLTATATSMQQINLAWTDNSNNETGFAISDSTDGINFTQVGTVGSHVVTYPVTGLTGSTTYYFKVSAFNSAGSADSNTASATTPLAPPANASNLIATAATSTQINLSWTDNSTLPEEDGFRIYRSTDNPAVVEEPNWVWAYVVGQNVTSYSVTGLTPNTSYWFYVVAYNAAGLAGPSNIASATTPQLPLAPSGLTATAASASEIDLAWTNNDATATGTAIYKSTDGVNFNWSYTMAAGVSSYAVQDLPQTSTYYFYVTAFNTNGMSSPSNTSSATTMALPAAPSNLVATTASSSEIDLAWTNNDPSATGTKIYKSTDGVNFTWSYVVGQGVNSYAVTGLSASTTYYFEVAAYDTAGMSAFSNTSSATTSPTTAPASASASASALAAPSGLSATAVYYNRINLAWTNNAANQNGFLIEESTDGINFTTIASVGADITSYWVNELSQMTTYYFRVIAYNTAGSSDPSNTINVTTPNYLA